MIDKLLTPLGIVWHYVLLWIIIILLLIGHLPGGWSDYAAPLAIIFLTVVYLLLFINKKITHSNIAKRRYVLDEVAKKYGYDFEAEYLDSYRSQNFQAIAKRDITTSNVVTLKDEKARYYDHSHVIYGKTRFGEYKRAYVYYSIVEILLPRKLPNIYFDSPLAHKKQYKLYFDKSQVQSLEGNFDKYFTTYFPKHYHIDSRAIITPEVMESMINASEFDIEITANRLYVYGPLVQPDKIIEMINKALAIRTSLMNNIVTYRDERLEYEAGRLDVAVLGANLRKNPYRSLIPTIVGLILIIFEVYVSFLFERINVSQVGILGVALAAGGIYDMVKIKKENNELDRLHLK